ncbi:MAG: hypothetical protein AAFR11_09500 [Pseudomonadota bacterium]
MLRFFISCLAGLFAIAAGNGAFAAPIKVLNDGYGNSGSQVNFASGLRLNDFGYSTGPQDLARSFEVDNGWSSSMANSAWTMSSDAAVFDLGFDQERTNGAGVFSRTLIGTMRFYATEDVNLAVAGVYDALGFGKSVYTLRLVDNLTGSILYEVDESAQWANSAAYSANYNVFLGAGSDIRLYFDAYVMSPSSGEYTAEYGSGVGSLNLAFSSTTPGGSGPGDDNWPTQISAPAGLSFLGLGLIGLAVARRRAG